MRSEFERADCFVGIRGCAVVVLKSTGFNQHTGMYVCMCECYMYVCVRVCVSVCVSVYM